MFTERLAGLINKGREKVMGGGRDEPGMPRAGPGGLLKT